MLGWLGDWLRGLPGWGQVVLGLAGLALLAWAIGNGRDLSPVWGLLGGG